ncbi:MAG: hypothetical protein KDD25_06835 [Bdellovibrionales bacterium]|nr:hypothetical protein [Bdellovibrionales bacterium]
MKNALFGLLLTAAFLGSPVVANGDSGRDWSYWDLRYQWGLEFEILEPELPNLLPYYNFDRLKYQDEIITMDDFLIRHPKISKGKKWSEMSEAEKAEAWLASAGEKAEAELGDSAPDYLQYFSYHQDDGAIEFILKDPVNRITWTVDVIQKFSKLAGVYEKVWNPDPKKYFTTQFHIHFDRADGRKDSVAPILLRWSWIMLLERVIMGDREALNPSKLYRHSNDLTEKGFVRLPDYPNSFTHGELRHHIYPLEEELRKLLVWFDMNPSEAVEEMDKVIVSMIAKNEDKISEMIQTRPDLGVEIRMALTDRLKGELLRDERLTLDLLRQITPRESAAVFPVANAYLMQGKLQDFLRLFKEEIVSKGESETGIFLIKVANEAFSKSVKIPPINRQTMMISMWQMLPAEIRPNLRIQMMLLASGSDANIPPLEKLAVENVLDPKTRLRGALFDLDYLVHFKVKNREITKKILSELRSNPLPPKVWLQFLSNQSEFELEDLDVIGDFIAASRDVELSAIAKRILIHNLDCPGLLRAN